jgi:very-short-patch-repair endonuclease
MTRYADLATLRRNISPDVVVIADARPTIAPAELDAAAIAIEVNEDALGVDVPNPLAAKFEHLWQTWQGPELVKEYRFHPHRRWRADYALVDAKVLIELEGGIYSGGRHSRASGFLADVEKYNAASMLGFVVLRLGTGQVDHQHVTEIIDWLRKGVR